jgi:hypothetical protein
MKVEEKVMKATNLVLVALTLSTMVVNPLAAADLTNKVKVEVESVGLHPGMDPGMYVCASGHLHIKGTVQNLADIPLRHVKVVGRAFDAEGKLLGTASAVTKVKQVAPQEKAEINVEFLTVTGPAINSVKRHQITVVEAPSL